MSRITRAAPLLAGLAALAACSDGPTATAPPGALDLAAPWETTTAAAAGMDVEALDRAVRAAEAIEELRSLVVVRGGRLVLERYLGGTGPDTPVDVRSVTKSVVSLLAGIALEEGLLEGLDQPVAPLLRRAGYAPRAEHEAVTVGHLLEMTGGFAWSEAGYEVADYNAWVSAPDPVGFLLDRPMAAPPGTAFSYNSAAVHLLGVVLEEVAGRPLPEWADQALFQPLGIRRATWEPLAGGRVNGGSGLDLRPRDVARLGQLMLQRGWSASRPVVPAPWVEAATTRRFPWAVEAGPMSRTSYGLLWWLDLDRDAFFAEGFRGQFLYVASGPELVVVATTARTGGDGVPEPEALRDEVASLVVDLVAAAR